jgi:hypothetical protein
MRLLALLLASCVVHGGEPQDIPSPTGFVFACSSDAGAGEWCFDGTALQLEDETGWTCQHTTRHAGPCLFRCPGGVGCHAFNGCYCPTETP